ncbi:Kinesin motor domain [Carpediemonas membranifera]|uniref:Kinesin motor domain n=1 Tax=Carpediemonas membranifera TaxID=201153 RepID=A0A8J6B6R7_9EUKA|nr:Kinesin motor domain [Carpediemonas membranifera]|eukprot:KAG9391152.1 Kinesin motor domain [Carpediemonas membranifera]
MKESEEGNIKDINVVTFPSNKTVTVQDEIMGPKPFNFDYVFQPDCKQTDVYDQIGRPAVENILKGYNSTVFAYGQTGAGKSWSMFGAIKNIETQGIIPRAAGHIFKHIESDERNTEYRIKCSFAEIYMEKIRDLLAPENDNLPVRESPDKGIYVEGLTESDVADEMGIMDVLEEGEKSRSVAFTEMNATSSRSHSVFIVKVDQRSEEGSSIAGKLNLVDLAGSEKVSKTGAKGQTFEEAKRINGSLSALGNCIKALVVGSKHIPYRDSKLTRILQESLGGNTKTTLIIACSPHKFNREETINTLKFGERAKTIKNVAKCNAQKSAAELLKIIKQLNIQIAKLKLYAKDLETEVEFYKNKAETGEDAAPPATLGRRMDVSLNDDEKEAVQGEVERAKEEARAAAAAKGEEVDEAKIEADAAAASGMPVDPAEGTAPANEDEEAEETGAGAAYRTQAQIYESGSVGTAELNARVADLQAKVKIAEEELSCREKEMQAEIDELQTALKEAANSADAEEMRRKEVEFEAALEEAEARAQADLDEKDRQLEGLQSDLALAKEQYARLEESKNEEIAALEEELEAKLTEAEETEEKLEELKETITEKEAELEELEAAKEEELKEELEAMEEELNDMQEQVAELEEAKAALEEELEEAKEASAGASEEELEELRQQHADAVAALESKVKFAEQELAANKAYLDEREKAVNEARKELGGAQETISANNEEIADLVTALSALEALVGTLEKDKAGLQADIVQLTKERDQRIAEERDETQVAMAAQHDTIRELKSQVAAAEDVQAKYQELQAEHEMLQDTNALLTSEQDKLAALKRRLEQENADLAAEREKYLQGELMQRERAEQLANTVAQLQGRLEKQTALLSELRAGRRAPVVKHGEGDTAGGDGESSEEVAALTVRIETKDEVIKKQTGTIAKIEADLERTREKLKEMKEELKALKEAQREANSAKGAELKTLKTELTAEFKEAEKTLKEELKASQKEASEARKEVKDAKAQAATFAETAEHATSKLERAEEELRVKTAAVTEAAEKVRIMQRRMDEAIAERDALQANMTEQLKEKTKELSVEIRETQAKRHARVWKPLTRESMAKEKNSKLMNDAMRETVDFASIRLKKTGNNRFLEEARREAERARN